jgi:hypothetical protein
MCEANVPAGAVSVACKKCPCPGTYSTHIEGLGTVPSYDKGFPTSIGHTRYAGTASYFRSMLRRSSDYYGVPYELSAVILQQENAPEASNFRRFLQSGERDLTTAAATVDEWFGIVPDRVAGSSSGIANLSRNTLRGAATYIERNYGRPVLPDEIRVRPFWSNADTRIPGKDVVADFYYMNAHLRELIDRVTGVKCYDGPLTLEQVEKIAAGYNGSGPLAAKYGRDAVARLQSAVSGGRPLYFYETDGP